VEDFPLQFDRPIWLWLLVLIVPVFLMARRSIGGQSRLKSTVTFALRVIVILLLSVALAEPVWEQRGEGLTVTVILDRSQSVPLPLKRSAVEFLADAALLKERDEDRVAVVSVARDAAIAAMPDRYSEVQPGADDGDLTATNLAAAVRLALAIMPDDTANRIVLASDGNETMDSVLAAGELAVANGVPIDVLVLEYEHGNEVIFERIIAPAQARRGQSANLKLVLRSQAEATGTVELTLNDQPFDLNGDEAGTGFRVSLEPGPRVITVPVSLDDPIPYRFEGIFVPDDVAMDGIDRNNRAMAVTFVSGEGMVLVVDDGVSESQYLVQALREGDISVDVVPPGGMGDLISLTGYDAVILANIPRWAFDDEQVRGLHAYVHDLGGGLVVLGGPNAFGAGGWIDTELARALPIKLDPPQTRQMPRGALALIMHSCEMPQGNYWGQQVAQAAIKALSRLDYVGIVEFNWNAVPGGQSINGCSWAFPMQLAGDKQAALAATKTMVVGDMPAFGPSMQLAINPVDGLKALRAGQKHAIIISDGDPQPPSAALVQEYIDAKVTVTTIMVAGHGSGLDRSAMQAIAQQTGGRFYNITNPKNLPEIFIKEAQIVSRSLIQEGDIYQPQVVSTLPGPAQGFAAVPPVTGYILTSPRDGLAQTPIVIGTSEGQDPVYAYWNYGLGRTIAYTSDITGRWGGAWPGWGDFKAFWEQSIRWSMRPSSPSNMLINTRLEGEKAIIDVEALDVDASYLNFMKMEAVVINPHADPDPLTLQQIGPGRYRGEFDVDQAGSYLIDLYYAGGTPDEPVQGHLPAAVTVPYSREFQAVKHNAALLKDLAARTGGDELIGGDPTLVNLFNMGDLEVPKSPKHIWDLLTILAASLFIFDVAARRLSVDTKWLAALFGRAVGREREVTGEALAAFRKTKGAAGRRGRAVPAAEPEVVDRTVKFEASEDDVGTAIDVGSESPEETRDAAAQAARRRPADEPPSLEDEEDFTSRLLRAKRRARRDQGEGDSGEGDEDG
jgi:uncharacterized membrane protein